LNAVKESLVSLKKKIAQNAKYSEILAFSVKRLLNLLL